jgi:competence protein ComEA
MLALLVMLIIAVSGVVLWPKEKPGAVVTPPPSAAEPNKEPEKHQNIIVYVSGEVKNPGVVSMAHGSRVIDAVNLLGGPTETANVQGVNMAAPLIDGQQIHVPSRDEDAGGLATAIASGRAGGKVNINTADVTALDTLPGVGPSTAQKIIDYRKNKGPFTSLEDLKKVPGIGENKYQNLKDKISL